MHRRRVLWLLGTCGATALLVAAALVMVGALSSAPAAPPAAPAQPVAQIAAAFGTLTTAGPLRDRWQQLPCKIPTADAMKAYSLITHSTTRGGGGVAAVKAGVAAACRVYGSG